MLKDAALCKNPLMFDPWAKILLSLKQTHMLATANYWPDVALLTPLQESWMKQPSSTEVFWGVYCIWGTFPQDQGYLTVFTKTYTTTETDRGERTLSLMNLKFTWQGKCNRWISQNSGGPVLVTQEKMTLPRSARNPMWTSHPGGQSLLQMPTTRGALWHLGQWMYSMKSGQLSYIHISVCVHISQYTHI